MGDRVPWATTYAPPSSFPFSIGDQQSLLDGFPFRLYNDDGSFDNGGAFDVAYTKAIKWFWRVRKWTVSAAIDLVDGMDNHTSFSASHDFDITDISVITRERDLTENPFTSYGGFYDFGDDVVMFFTISPSSAQLRTDNGKIRSPMIIHVHNADTTTVQNVNADLEEGGVAPNATLADGATYDGEVSDLYYNDNASSLVSASIVVTPIKFWPYKNKAGDPVYDEDTGAQINDPLG